MPRNSVTYKLLCRFESVIRAVDTLTETSSKFPRVRFKPLYTDYNSCVDEFSRYSPTEFKQLNLESLPLYDDEGRELFTNEKLSTLLHQAQAITALLKGSLPPGYSGGQETMRESWAWYWNNTHYKLLVGLIILLLTHKERVQETSWSQYLTRTIGISTFLSAVSAMRNQESLKGLLKGCESGTLRLQKP
jgi:hypothetical protein